MEGLTGNISFTDEGKRKDYSLDVVEMTFSSETIKVSVATNVNEGIFLVALVVMMVVTTVVLVVNDGKRRHHCYFRISVITFYI